jgi:hypothetical protein
MYREQRSPHLKSQSECPIKGQGLGAKAPMCSDAFPDAVRLSEHHMPG